MKLIVALISILILTSCGTSNNVVSEGIFQKRKYQRGFFWKKRNVEITEKSSEHTNSQRESYERCSRDKGNKYTKVITKNTPELNDVERSSEQAQPETLKRGTPDMYTSPESAGIKDQNPEKLASTETSDSESDTPDDQRTRLDSFFTTQSIISMVSFTLGVICALTLIGLLFTSSPAGPFLLAATFILVPVGFFGVIAIIISVFRLSINGRSSDYHFWGTLTSAIIWMLTAGVVAVFVSLN